MSVCTVAQQIAKDETARIAAIVHGVPVGKRLSQSEHNEIEGLVERAIVRGIHGAVVAGREGALFSGRGTEIQCAIALNEVAISLAKETRAPAPRVGDPSALKFRAIPPVPETQMKVITTGHKYELASFEGGTPQTLQFIEKTPNLQAGNGLLFTVNDGTTNEEMLRVLIDRMQYLNGVFPCRENALVITKLEESLMWLNKRTADRLARAVEGKAVA